MSDATLSERLDALLGERWPFFRGRIVTDASGAEAIPMTGLVAPRRARACLERFARHYPGQDLRGVASLWTQWYAVTTWPPLATAALVLGTAPELDAEATALLVDDSGCPVGLRVAARETDQAPEAWLENLARNHAAPLMDLAAETARMSPRVPWSNVANVLGWTLGELAAVADPATLAPGHRLLSRRQWPDAVANPLFLGAHEPAAGARPARRTCCLRYRLDDFGYCADCPIPPAARRA